MAPATCPAKYEPEAKAINTHTCDKDEGHDGDHHCPCGEGWDEPRPSPPVSVRQQARKDVRRMWIDAFGTEP